MPPEITIPKDEQKQSAQAKEYERKIGSFVGELFNTTVGNEATVADSAAFILYGGQFARAWGNLADKDVNVRKAVDWITAPSTNPYALAVVATLPLVLQIVRNHEDVELERPLKFRFFRKEFKFHIKWGLRIRNRFFRSRTKDPESLVRQVYSDPDIIEQMKAEGIEPAIPSDWLARMKGGRGRTAAS